MELTWHIALIVTACLLDVWLGDPVYAWHPIRLLGSLSLWCEDRLFAIGQNGRAGGIIHWVLMVGSALGVWWGIHSALSLLHPLFAWLWDVFIAYSLLCTRDLLTHGQRVLNSLENLSEARHQLSQLVGRDTNALSRGGIVRATIESLSENFTDGVLTPLWALCLFGIPGLMLVKTVSGLDSMIGYKNQRYLRFGWAAARSDDVVHWLPARLSVALIIAAAAILKMSDRLNFHPQLVWSTAKTDHALLDSPNSGWSEAACAGALRVRLLGPIHYEGKKANDVFMGSSDWPADLTGADLKRALRLIMVGNWLALLAGFAVTPLILLW